MRNDPNGPGLGETAEDFYNSRLPKRSGAESRARRLADLTVPSVFLPEDWQDGDDLEVTNQSTNAFCINSLSNKLMLAALPPNLPMAAYTPNEDELQEDIQQNPELWSQMVYAFSRREESHRKRLKKTKARTTYARTMRLMLSTGNGCTIWTKIDTPRTYDLNHYVTLRDAGGTPIVTVLKDAVTLAVADEDVKDAVRLARAKQQAQSPKSEWDDEVAIYHCQKLLVGEDGSQEWVYWQEVEGGYIVPDTEAYSPFDVPAMMPGTIILPTGADWGLPYCGDYEGDLQATENFAAALQDGAAALAWFLFFVDPTGHTNIKDVQEADTLDVLSGRADDVTTLQVPKGGDLTVVSNEFEKAARRLGYAFAVQTSIQRSGERVTAEEWKRMSQELDQAMGGLYTDLSQGYQRWFVLRFVHLHELEGKGLAPLPDGMVQVDVLTGLDSIGQSTEHSNLMEWAMEGQQVLGPEVFAAEINGSDFLRRTAANRGVKTEGLIKSSDQKASEKQQQLQQAQQQTLLDKATGPLAQAGGDLMASMAEQPQSPQ